MHSLKPRFKAPYPHLVEKTTEILRKHRLNTVCEAAACPNRAECYFTKIATFMILGDVCTRACTFCNVKTGKGAVPDGDEPRRLAGAIEELGLEYAVITSVDRDDLSDYGAGHFVSCVEAIKKACPGVKIELLTPDFRANTEALKKIVHSRAEKLAHNQETVKRLCFSVRPQSSYERSLKTLEYYAQKSKSIVKSSLMVGLGENESELLETMKDLLDVGVSELTIGQYLQPTSAHHPVKKYYPADFFEQIKAEALGMGFSAVASGILVRSSYHAKEL
jgi:lipoic acid synthetase